MYITNVASHLGAWTKLVNSYPIEYQEMQSVISNITASDCLENRAVNPSRDNQYSPDRLRLSIKTEFEERGWQTRETLQVAGNKSRTSVIDVIKNSIGVEYTFGKFSYTESVIFVKFSLFIKADKFKIGFVVTPTMSMTRSMPFGIGSFDMVRDRIRDITPLPLKYPFGIIGVSDQSSDLVVEEFTSNLDQYLLDVVGYSLLEMSFQTEKQNFDFKLDVPENQTLAREICGFANLVNGGLLLVGVNNDGDAIGILRSNIDALRGRILQVSRTNISPNPELNFEIFDVPDHDDRCILVVNISEFPGKPCMFQERVYIRSGPEVRVAKPHEIRKMILGGEK